MGGFALRNKYRIYRADEQKDKAPSNHAPKVVDPFRKLE